MGEPVLEARLAESRVIAGNKCALAQLGAVVARVRVSDNFARIVTCADALPDEIVETELFGPRYFNRAIHWRANRDPGDRAGDIVSRIGWMNTGARRTVLPSVAASAMDVTN